MGRRYLVIQCPTFTLVTLYTIAMDSMIAKRAKKATTDLAYAVSAWSSGEAGEASRSLFSECCPCTSILASFRSPALDISRAVRTAGSGRSTAVEYGGAIVHFGNSAPLPSASFFSNGALIKNK